MPRAVSDVILHCLEKDPENRYQSATGLAYDLDACLEAFRARGDIPEFAPGRRDWSPRLQLSSRLYGRDGAIQEIVDAFQQIRAGGTSMVIIRGSAGCGKTSLLDEVRRMLHEETQHLAYVRFFPTAASVPYAMLFEAFGRATTGLAALPDEEVPVWRMRLLSSLGEDAPLLESLIPHLSTLLGGHEGAPRPSLAPPSPDDLRRAINKLVSAYASKKNPVVLCFDDLQWADEETLGWLCALPEADIPQLLAVCTLTDNSSGVQDGDENHESGDGMESSVQALTRAWQAESGLIDLPIEPLTAADVNHWLSEMLRVGQTAVADLTAVLLEKTGGNPFFLRQLLVTLQQSGALRMDAASGSWRWDSDAVRRAELADNMVDHAIARLHQLPPDLLKLLTLAACVGNRFDADLLATLSGEDPAETLVCLREAEEQGLVTGASWQDRGASVRLGDPHSIHHSGSASLSWGGGHYEFAHPLLQHAAYGLLAEPLRREMHLGIARHLLSLSPEEREERANDLAEHCRAAGALLHTPEEKRLAAEACLSAAGKARTAGAFARAVQLYREGAELLGEGGWDAAHELAFALCFGQMECHYACAEYDEMLAVGDRILAHAPTGAQALAVYGLQMNLFVLRDQYKEIERIGRESLATVGIALPERVTRTAAMRALREVDERMKGLSTEDIVRLPEATDPVVSLATRMLLVASNASPLLGRWWNVLVAAKRVQLTLERGMTPSSPTGLFAPAMRLELESRKYLEQTCRWAEAALPLAERYAHDLRTLRNTTLYYAGYVAPWREPWSTVVSLQERYQELSFSTGAAAFGVLHLPHLLMARWISGHSMADLRNEAEDTLRLAAEYDVSFTAAAAADALRVFVRLQEAPDSPEQGLGFPEREYPMEQAEILLLSMTLQCFAALLLDRPDEGLCYAQRGFALLDAGVDLDPVFFVNLVFLYALTLTALGESGTGPHAPIFRRLRRMLRLWADFYPPNFRYQHLIVEAEVRRLRGDRTRAMDLYDEAIAACKEGGFTHLAALASELAGRFYLATSKPKLARPYLVEARYLFAEWGAAAKVRLMDERYAEWLRTTASGDESIRVGSFPTNVAGPPGTWSDNPTRPSFPGSISVTSEAHRSGAGTHQLDLATILKTSQAISGEIDLGQLLTRLLELAMENAGARKGCWILPREGQWRVLLGTEPDGGSGEALTAQALSQSTAVPQRIVQYVIRSGETLVLHDAAKEGRFRRDPFVARRSLRSVLCYPVRQQGRTVAILYLENDLAAHVFTSQRIEVLNLLSGQAAVSIENAIVYETLEQRVAERTAELQRTFDTLQRTQQQMVESEKMASLGELTAGVAHEINNPINFVAGNVQPLRRDVADVLQVLDAYADTVARQGLQAEFAEAEALREEVEIDYVREEMEQLLQGVEEGARRTAEIVKGLRNFSRLDEDDLKKASVPEGIDSTLMLLRRKYEPGIRIIRSYAEDVPEVECLPGKLNQVYMNLLSNAIQAIPGEGEIHIGVEVPLGTDSVRIRIRDTGKGMEKDVMERIFEPFFTTKEVGVGTGLGLSISYGIIERHKGSIEVDSEPGKGTTFTILLPIHQTDA